MGDLSEKCWGVVKLFKDRNLSHKYMGEGCPRCLGRGWYETIKPGDEDERIPDTVEVYCDCICGDKRAELEG